MKIASVALCQINFHCIVATTEPLSIFVFLSMVANSQIQFSGPPEMNAEAVFEQFEQSSNNVEVQLRIIFIVQISKVQAHCQQIQSFDHQVTQFSLFSM